MKMNRIWLSIIIPTYNVEEYIGECLESVVKGGKTDNIEVLVVDDGSTDKSGEIADSYAEKYPFIKAVHRQNGGVASARNMGLENTVGEWVYFIDSDDWLVEGAIDMISLRTLLNADADIIMFDAYKNTGKSEIDYEHFQNQAIFDTKQDINKLQYGMLYSKVSLAATWDKVYRREFLIENELLFTPKLKVLDDMVFNMEAFGKAKKVAYFKHKIYHYRQVEDSITNSYSPNRVSYDMEVWEYIEAYIRSNLKIDDELFRQAYYCRIIKSFGICCRLCFFNSQNDKSFREKLGYVKNIMETEPYTTAFKKVKMKNVEWKLKIMILMGRVKLSFGVWMLHVAQNGLQ
jgi:glycosyltransferase involved in cell wall biosynthesis